MVTSKARRRISISREAIALGGLVLCVIVAVIAVLSVGRAGRPTLTITGGDAAGIRHEFARVLAAEALPRGVRMEVTPTAGSVDALRKVASGEVDLALVQGGIDAQDPVRQLTALHIEPLHLLVRPDLAPSVGPSLRGLEGCSINIGAQGSGTRRLSLAILRFVGLAQSDNSSIDEETEFLSLTYDELLAIESHDALPDAIFAVSSLPSPVVASLTERFGYVLAPLSFGPAFAINALVQADRPQDGTELRVDRRDVEQTVVPPMTYDRDPPVPADPLNTLGLRLLLVCRDDLPAGVAERVLESVFETRFARVGSSPITTALLDLPTQHPPHRAAERYRRRDLPLLTGDSLGILDSTVNITAPALGGMLFLWTWIRSRRRRRRETSFREYVREVNAIEVEALAIERAEHTPIHRLVQLQRDLSQMKTEAMERFAHGEVRGEQALSGFLSLVQDTRDFITRLIAQERELKVHGDEHEPDVVD